MESYDLLVQFSCVEGCIYKGITYYLNEFLSGNKCHSHQYRLYSHMFFLSPFVCPNRFQCPLCRTVIESWFTSTELILRNSDAHTRALNERNHERKLHELGEFKYTDSEIAAVYIYSRNHTENFEIFKKARRQYSQLVDDILEADVSHVSPCTVDKFSDLRYVFDSSFEKLNTNLLISEQVLGEIEENYNELFVLPKTRRKTCMQRLSNKIDEYITLTEESTDLLNEMFEHINSCVKQAFLFIINFTNKASDYKLNNKLNL